MIESVQLTAEAKMAAIRDKDRLRRLHNEPICSSQYQVRNSQLIHYRH